MSTAEATSLWRGPRGGNLLGLIECCLEVVPGGVGVAVILDSAGALDLAGERGLASSVALAARLATALLSAFRAWAISSSVAAALA
ncbi:MAG: hypothetical protein ACLU0O_10040 [Collinsella sp.]